MDISPYYAPAYFPASYSFAAVPALASSPTGPMPYNTPAYFAPAYFYGPATSSASGPMPYNAPAYFAPAYFYGPAASAGSGPMPYNAPTYFSPTYFYGASSSVVVPVAPTPEPDPVPLPGPDPSPDPGPTPDPSPAPVSDPVVGDLDPYSALLALMRSSGVFEDVIFGAATQRSQAGADTYPLAVLTPRSWEEADEVDPSSVVRRVTFSISVVVKAEDDLPKFDELDRLSAAIKRVVDGSNLGGACLPALTRIGSGHYVYSNHYPEQSIELEGEFSSIIDAPANAPGLP